jgi:hypothetical protein
VSGGEGPVRVGMTRRHAVRGSAGGCVGVKLERFFLYGTLASFVPSLLGGGFSQAGPAWTLGAGSNTRSATIGLNDSTNPRRRPLLAVRRLKKRSEGARLSEIVFARNSGELQRVFRQAPLAAAHQRELGGKHFSERERIGVGKARDPRFHPIDKRNCAIDLAEGPTGKRQIRNGGDAGVWPEAKCHFVIAPWLEQRERTFKTLPCFAIFSGEPVSDALEPLPDASTRASRAM